MIEEEKTNGSDRMPVEMSMQVSPQQPMIFIITSVFMLNAMPNKRAVEVAKLGLAKIAHTCWKIPNNRFYMELANCQMQLFVNRARLTWWIDEKGIHYDYETKAKS